jgi:hypothetical protein
MTYSQNLRRRRAQNKWARKNGQYPSVDSTFPIPGVRTQATILRKQRSRDRRAARKAAEVVK